MTMDNSTIKNRIKNLLRSPSIKLRRNKPRNNKESLGNKVTLEKVLGITAAGNRALACDPHSGLVAYPAGCVVVLLNPKKNKQYHILNNSRKTITTLAFSPDGKYVVTGESGHMPAVRVWDVVARTQVAELQEHKFGVACVAFSPNSKYIVSVGYQHDMIVNVWAWKKNVLVAANKVSSKVMAVSFSDDSSYFVTAGNRHVKFWYLDHTKASKVNATVPLLGRSGLLGELRNNFFSDVACGKGRKASSTFCITSSGLLCEFNDKRLLDKWVELRTGLATALSVTEDLIFCGCADGTVRAFNPVNLHFICTLPRPHSLGTDISTVTDASHLFAYKLDARYPDTVAVSYDPVNHWLSCVYNDHSLYVWDVRDLHKVGKVYSALYHSSCVWSVEIYPQNGEKEQSCITPGCFLSCSSDNTIRLWSTDGYSTTVKRNVISNDLQKIIYVDNNVTALLDQDCTISSNSEKADSQTFENRTGIRTMCVSPDGQHLASGDRNGILRIHELKSMEEILNVQAHDSEILCLEYSKPETANEGKVRMISCGADKSIYFRTAHETDDGLMFTRTHHIVRKTTLYDMDIDPLRKYAAIGCQDRSIRIFNISNGKQKKIYKGSQGEDGTLIKVQMDPSGMYVATSCSDKNINIFDFYTGECVATMFGHSEIVTGMKFTNDCKHLISVSGDSCIFVWRLNPELTINMRQRLSDLKQNSKPVQKSPPAKHYPVSHRGEVHSVPVLGPISSDSDKELEEEEVIEEEDNYNFPHLSSGSSTGEETGSSEEKHESFREISDSSLKCETSGPRQRRRWANRTGSTDLIVKSMLDLRQLQSFAKSPVVNREPALHPDPDLGSTISLQTLAGWVEEPEVQVLPVQKGHIRPRYIPLSPQTPDPEAVVLYPEGCEDRMSLAGSEYQVKELAHNSEPTEPLSVDGNSSELDMEDLEEEEKEDKSLKKPDMCSSVPQTLDQEAFLKKNFSNLSDFSTSGSTPFQLANTDSMSSKFLTGSSSCRQASDSPLCNATDSEVAGKLVHPPVSEVRPLIQDRELNGLQKLQSPERPSVLHLTSAKKHTPVDTSANFLTTSSGMKKAQSIHSISSEGDLLQTSTNLLMEVPPQLQPSKRAPLSMPRRTLPSVPLSSPTSSQSRECPTPTKSKPRSYMSPTTSSIAKMSRSMSMSDSLNVGEHSEVPAGSDSYCNSGSDASNSRNSSCSKPSSPVVPLPSSFIGSPSRSAVIPTINGATTNNSSSRGIQAKLPIGARPQLHLDITKPLPDKPSLASFSPNSKLTKLGHKENLDNRLSEWAPPLPGPEQCHSSNMQSIISSVSAESRAVTQHPLNTNQNEESEKIQRQNSMEETQSIQHRDSTVCLQTASHAQDSGLLGFHSSLVLSSVPLRLGLPKHFITSRLWYLSPSFSSITSAMFSSSLFPSINPSRLKDKSLSMESCKLAASELQNSLKKACQFYMMLSKSTEQSQEHQEMAHVLTEAFDAVQIELNSLPRYVRSRSGSSSSSPCVLGSGVGEEQTLALLEQYSQLLLRAVEKRMDNKI
ncbi:Mitogen-activated protein kinase-binding protein 1 [Bagarius yarrelli]|uniref:Mitogen-activated protein kinase-binding protein 1 n=1 Tax=Bagarius yarrelli TaxID=175774 RepID=A0A556U980_BAGYA|nr:Mitogen-activated protein kinase-binding protein 1 [Bagarius yarrelli]